MVGDLQQRPASTREMQESPLYRQGTVKPVLSKIDEAARSGLMSHSETNPHECQGPLVAGNLHSRVFQLQSCRPRPMECLMDPSSIFGHCRERL